MGRNREAGYFDRFIMDARGKRDALRGGGSKASQVQNLANRGSGQARKGQGRGINRVVPDFQGTKRAPSFRIGGSPGLSPNRYGGGVG